MEVLNKYSLNDWTHKWIPLVCRVKHLPRVMIFVLEQPTIKMIHSSYWYMDNRTDHPWRQLLICPQGCHVQQLRLCTAQHQGSLLPRWQCEWCPPDLGPEITSSNKGCFILKSMTGEACNQIIHSFIHSLTILGLRIWPWTKMPWAKYHLIEKISHQEIIN